MKVLKLLIVLIVICSSLVFFITRSHSIHSIVSSIFRNIYQKIDLIDVEGNDTIPTEKIIAALYDIDNQDRMILKTKKDIVESLKQFSLIDSVSIKYTLPSKLLIIVQERKPLLFYYTEYKTPIIVDNNFNEFVAEDLSLENLIFVRGKYEKDVTEHFINFIRQFPIVYENLTEMEVFFGYRFNIVLNNRLHILLPEKNPENALKMLVKFIVKFNILNTNVYRIDFRNDQKVFFASDPKAIKYKPEMNRFVLYNEPQKESQYKQIIENAIAKI